MSDVLALQAIEQHFTQGNKTLEVLKGISLSIKQGEVVGLVGQSGSGKSTLLQIAGLLEKPAAGDVVIQGQNSSEIHDQDKTILRRDHIGFVYQYHHLLPEFSALENVTIPRIIAGKDNQETQEKAEQLLSQVGLEERLHHRPAELSGGEQQRVAIVRALSNEPSLLLADEPTGNLDPETGNRIFEMMFDLVKAQNSAALIVTHNQDLAKRCDRMIALENGKVV